MLQGPVGALAAAGPNLVQLDLTDNLLSSWDSVCQICSELPQLRVLQLSSNRLALPCSMASAGPCAVQVLPGLQCLVLNQCSITWQQVRGGATVADVAGSVHAAVRCSFGYQRSCWACLLSLIGDSAARAAQQKPLVTYRHPTSS
jgi:hypothetical protein